MKPFFSWLLAHKIASIILLVVLIGGGVLLSSGEPTARYDSALVERTTLVQTVNVTGTVQAEQSVELAFERSGRISGVFLGVGEKVKKGDVIVRLDGSEIQAGLLQAEANVSFEKARLAEILRGARPEEIAVSKVKLMNAESALADSARSLKETLLDAYTKADDAVRNKTDKLFNNPRTNNPDLNIPLNNVALSAELVELRKKIEQDLLEWNTKIATLENPEPFIAPTKAYLDRLKTYLEKLAFAVNSIVSSTAVSQTTIESWKADVSTARASANTAAASVIAAEEKWRSANSSVVLAREELTLKEIGASAEEIAAQEAKIASAEASVASYRAQLSKFVLTAPFGGVITRQDAKLGALAGANAVIVAIQSEGAFKIEADIPEVDIAKIAIGDPAEVTLDAYERDIVFPAAVILIDPAERIIDGIPTYRVTLRFEDLEGRARSGMTANVEIETDRAENVLAVPGRSIEQRNGGVVRVLGPNDVVEEREIHTGVRASNGLVEVHSGLNEEERVITFDRGVQ